MAALPKRDDDARHRSPLCARSRRWRRTLSRAKEWTAVASGVALAIRGRVATGTATTTFGCVTTPIRDGRRRGTLRVPARCDARREPRKARRGGSSAPSPAGSTRPRGRDDKRGRANRPLLAKGADGEQSRNLRPLMGYLGDGRGDISQFGAGRRRPCNYSSGRAAGRARYRSGTGATQRCSAAR